jgi:dTMP kinase
MVLMIGFIMIHEKTPGVLITFEGIDGSGKSSAARFLYERIQELRPALLTKEPGGTELGKHLRTLLQLRTYPVSPEAEFLLFAADRAQHWRECVMPALQEGIVVISDRMADSSLAYQGYGRGVDHAMIESVNRWAMCGMKPDLTIYLKIDYATAMSRLADREETTVFDTMFATRDNVITVDARLPEHEVHEMIMQQALGLQGDTGSAYQSNDSCCKPQQSATAIAPDGCCKGDKDTIGCQELE